MNAHVYATPRIRATTIVYLCGQVMDMLTTLVGVTMFGAVEGNPMVNHIGWFASFLFKLACMIATTWFLQADKPKICLKVFDWIFPIVAISPVFWNLFQLSKVVIR